MPMPGDFPFPKPLMEQAVERPVTMGSAVWLRSGP